MSEKLFDSGIYKISNELYHTDPCIEPSLSRSIIYELLFHSPAHAWWKHPRLNPEYKEDNDEKFDIGSAAHSLLLEGFNSVAIIQADDWRKKETKEQRDIARSVGKIPLLEKQWNNVEAMVLSAVGQIINNCKELGIKDLLTEGDSELTYIWQDGKAFLRSRPDWVSKDRKLIIDYKTTGNSANPSEFSRQIISMGLDIQAALYIRGIKSLEGIEPKFIFVVQETSEPYLCSFIGLPPEFLEMGKSKVDYGIKIWEKCLLENNWTGYPNRIAYIDPPSWALAQWELIAQEISLI